MYESSVEGIRKGGLQTFDRQPIEHLSEEAADQQSLGSWPPQSTALQVIEMVFLQGTYGRSMPAHNVVAKDLEVGHRVSLGIGRQDQVAIRFECGGADRGLLDPHQAGEDRLGLILDGALEQDLRSRFAATMSQGHAIVEHLIAVSEEEAHHFGRGALTVEFHPQIKPAQFPPEARLAQPE
jgi:hypothetical protein